MVDIRRAASPTVIADGTRLPFRDAAFDFVVIDPPYSEKDARELYGTDYPGPVKLIGEGFRVLSKGGHLVFLHEVKPGHEPQLPPERIEVANIGVATVACWSRTRTAVVYRKGARRQMARLEGFA